MDHELELRLQRIAGHARRGWKQDAARELNVTPRTIHRALTGYVPQSLIDNITDVERRRMDDGKVTVMDLMLRRAMEAAVDAPPDPASDINRRDRHYLAGMADGWSTAIREMMTRISEENRGLLERISSQVDREMPERRAQNLAARELRAPGSIGEQMLERLAKHFREERNEEVWPDMQFRGREREQPQIDVQVVISLRKILDAIWRNGPEEGRRVADAEEIRLRRWLTGFLSLR